VVWNGGTLTNAANPATVSAAGTYTATATNSSNGCTTTASVTVNASPGITSFSVNTINANCASNDGSLTVTSVNGGTAPYTYNGNASATISNLPSGQILVTVQDANGCTADSIFTIGLNGGFTIDAGNDTIIEAGVSVPINVNNIPAGSTVVWSPTAGLSCTNCANPTATPQVSTDYVITVTDSNGCTDSDTLRIAILYRCIGSESEIEIPNAFSPNGDGNHDVLYMEAEGITGIEWKMYNKWGELVWETQSLGEGWDGKQNGKPLDAAVFVYYLKVTCATGEEFMLKGNVTLLK
jgi:gliding motility-associated-like protein